MKVLGYAAHSATEPLAPYDFERRAPRPDDVVIDILYCGVCHTDLHLARNHFGMTTYPIVPGHEIIGRVAAVGPEVTRFQPQDVVGVGCMVDSCRQCVACSTGHEQHCTQGPVFTYGSVDRRDQTRTFGGYSQRIVVSDHFVVRVPDGLDPAGAAPLLCAGVTTWSPLRRWKIGPGAKVGVIGLGGLGHMALKLAKGLGADVTLFTRSRGKEGDARRLGADHVIVSTDATQMNASGSRFDLVIDTVPYDHSIAGYLPTLNFDGALVLVGYMGPLAEPVNTGPLVFGRRALAGSFIGGVAETQDMLDFCGAHGITSDIELIPIQQIDAAYERMLKGDVKYRFVIDMASLHTAHRTTT
jgi:uncharacterized zinc-type alcohol dehydrogenase-like protein